MSDVSKTAYDPIENALFKVRFPDSGDATIDGEDEFVQEGARIDKAVFLAALEENGMVISPRKQRRTLANPISNALLREHIFLGDDGKLRWARNKPNGVVAGDLVAGRLIGRSGNEYEKIRIMVGGKRVSYLTHRVVYQLFHNIELSPDDILDHIDGNRFNNSPYNLRLSTPHLNSCNKPNRGTRSSFENGKYRVRSRVARKLVEFGDFPDQETASRVCDAIDKMKRLYEDQMSAILAAREG